MSKSKRANYATFRDTYDIRAVSARWASAGNRNRHSPRLTLNMQLTFGNTLESWAIGSHVPRHGNANLTGIDWFITQTRNRATSALLHRVLHCFSMNMQTDLERIYVNGVYLFYNSEFKQLITTISNLYILHDSRNRETFPLKFGNEKGRRHSAFSFIVLRITRWLKWLARPWIQPNINCMTLLPRSLARVVAVN